MNQESSATENTGMFNGDDATNQQTSRTQVNMNQKPSQDNTDNAPDATNNANDAQDMNDDIKIANEVDNLDSETLKQLVLSMRQKITEKDDTIKKQTSRLEEVNKKEFEDLKNKSEKDAEVLSEIFARLRGVNLDLTKEYTQEEQENVKKQYNEMMRKMFDIDGCKTTQDLQDTKTSMDMFKDTFTGIMCASKEGFDQFNKGKKRLREFQAKSAVNNIQQRILNDKPSYQNQSRGISQPSQRFNNSSISRRNNPSQFQRREFRKINDRRRKFNLNRVDFDISNSTTSSTGTNSCSESSQNNIPLASNVDKLVTASNTGVGTADLNKEKQQKKRETKAERLLKKARQYKSFHDLQSAGDLYYNKYKKKY